MSEYSAPTPIARHRWWVPDELALYLHNCGVCANPREEQAEGDTPAVFINRLADTPDRALALLAYSEDHTISDSNPTARITLLFRGQPDDQTTPEEDAERAFTALHEIGETQMTARLTVLASRRIINDPPVPDNNRRWHRADTYELVLAALR